MQGHVFIAPGDLTQLSADAIAFSAANSLLTNGDLYSSFDANVPGECEKLHTAVAAVAAAHSGWSGIPLRRLHVRGVPV